MIHQYKLNGYNIVMDVNSGAVHSVDEVAYDIIALYDKGVPREEIIDEIKLSTVQLQIVMSMRQ